MQIIKIKIIFIYVENYKNLFYMFKSYENFLLIGKLILIAFKNKDVIFTCTHFEICYF